MDYRELASPTLWQRLRSRRYVVEGDSMFPLLEDGDIVYTKKNSFVAEHDIVVLPHPFRSKYIVKQVTEVHGEMLELAGLNADESEDSRTFGYIPQSHILGTVIAKQ